MYHIRVALTRNNPACNTFLFRCHQALQTRLTGYSFSTGNEKDDLVHETSDLSNIKIPAYKPKTDNEPTVQKRARLHWQSRKRGIAENCLILSTFAEKYLNDMNTEQLVMYDSLINQSLNDWEMYYWMTGAKSVPKEYDNEIMDMLQVHCKNEEKTERFEQPPLCYEPVEKV